MRFFVVVFATAALFDLTLRFLRTLRWCLPLQSFDVVPLPAFPEFPRIVSFPLWLFVISWEKSCLEPSTDASSGVIPLDDVVAEETCEKLLLLGPKVRNSGGRSIDDDFPTLHRLIPR